MYDQSTCPDNVSIKWINIDTLSGHVDAIDEMTQYVEKTR